ncbi:Hypothetical_protein [Hexamita inflata]|uniref:Hypothetical_protein n=1 Tax=Hexamita inflata TaxID=28002 RepID=A0ABP1HVZ3_9EUKA
MRSSISLLDTRLAAYRSCGQLEKASDIHETQKKLFKILYKRANNVSQTPSKGAVNVTPIMNGAKITDNKEIDDRKNRMLVHGQIGEDEDFMDWKFSKDQYSNLPVLKDDLSNMNLVDKNEQLETMNWYSKQYAKRYAESMRKRMGSQLGRTWGLNGLDTMRVESRESIARSHSQVKNNSKVRSKSNNNQGKEEIEAMFLTEIRK